MILDLHETVGSLKTLPDRPPEISGPTAKPTITREMLPYVVEKLNDLRRKTVGYQPPDQVIFGPLSYVAGPN